MNGMQNICRTAIMAGIMMTVLVGCSYYKEIQQLSAPEKERFRIYAKVMSSSQMQHYLKQSTATARTAYLQEIGLAQRFQALTPQDREAVRNGQIRSGMSAEALRFLWGEPDYNQGWDGHYEHWYYNGSTWELSQSGNVPSEVGTIVIVDLVDGKVDGWFETVPTDIDKGEGNDFDRR